MNTDMEHLRDLKSNPCSSVFICGSKLRRWTEKVGTLQSRLLGIELWFNHDFGGTRMRRTGQHLKDSLSDVFGAQELGAVDVAVGRREGGIDVAGANRRNLDAPVGHLGKQRPGKSDQPGLA